MFWLTEIQKQWDGGRSRPHVSNSARSCLPIYQQQAARAGCWSAEGEKTPRCPPPREIYRRADLRFCCSMRFTPGQWWARVGCRLLLALCNPVCSILEPKHDAQSGGVSAQSRPRKHQWLMLRCGRGGVVLGREVGEIEGRR